MSKWRLQNLPSPTGANLQVHSIAPNGAARAIIQINHGMAEHSARYRRFAQFLASRGYWVCAHDHRGHGKTTATDAPLGVFAAQNGMARVLDDVTAVISHARSACPDTPLVVFGHSMGTIIALNHAWENPNAGQALALWNTSFDTPLLMSLLVGILKAERMLKGSDVPSAIANKVTFDAWNKEFSPNRTPFDWLSRDEAEVDAYVNDPLCGFPVAIGTWLEVLGSITKSANDKNLARLPKSLPVSIVAGGRDPSSLKGAAMLRLAARLQASGLTDVSAKVYPHTRHEGLNETNRDTIMADFADWLDVRFAPGG